MDNTKATEYLELLLNKKLRVHTNDRRMFIGDFKCTDNECNVILSQSYEYRPPTESAIKAATEACHDPGATVKLDMTSRFLGLIVVPGQHITKIEVEDP
ncbi:hypothetical protein JMJ35_000808 [Cladonia borealis]|uniref:Sm domain-containing protein n=1 Tax=Cladonia borealis TaxID=184061 RepID=A0AA39R7E2_9LECA|nr:hypothetical protein JMJ35_000808 [Cladonia borealis]